MISPLNYNNSTVYIEPYYILEATEFAINPFITYDNSSAIATNVFEVNIYNQTTNSKINVQNLTNGFDMYFPIIDNLNLTTFANNYLSLNPYKNASL